MKEKKGPEPTFEMLSNPARVMKQQLPVISLADGSKYVPLKDLKIGIQLVKKTISLLCISDSIMICLLRLVNILVYFIFVASGV